MNSWVSSTVSHLLAFRAGLVLRRIPYFAMDNLATEAGRDSERSRDRTLAFPAVDSVTNLLNLLPRQQLAVRFVLRPIELVTCGEQAILEVLFNANVRLPLRSDSLVDGEHRVRLKAFPSDRPIEQAMQQLVVAVPGILGPLAFGLDPIRPPFDAQPDTRGGARQGLVGTRTAFNRRGSPFCDSTSALQGLFPCID